MTRKPVKEAKKEQLKPINEVSIKEELVSTSAGKGMSWNGAGEKALEDEEEAI